MGVDIARAALAADHAVVATGRNADIVTAAVGPHADLIAIELDVTDPGGADAAVRAAVERFGRWMESLTPEVAPFGIRTMLVEPGFFRTDLLTPESTKYAEPSIDDYAERTRQTVSSWNGMNGKQGGDPAKLAGALIHLATLAEPPFRFVAGTDAVATVEKKAGALLAQVDAHRELSTQLAHDKA